MFSERTSWDFTPNELALARSQSSFEGEWVDLTASNPTTVGLAFPVEAMIGALASPQVMRYEPASTGLASMRLAVAETYRARRIDVDPADIVLTASSSEAYAFLLKLLCDPGDNILVPQPSYPLFDDLARLEAVGIRGYPLRADDGWRTDLEALRGAVDASTRAIFVVSPNNPTGSYLVREERDAIEQVALEHGLAIVCDEVFAEYVWRDDPERVRCAASEARALTFSLGGLSKSVALPQMKLGWIVAGGQEQQRREALARLDMIGDTFLSVGTPIQHAAPTLLERGRVVREQLQQRIRVNLEALRSRIDSHSAVSVLPVRAGWYALLRLPALMPGEAWAALLAREAGVSTHPGEFFGVGEHDVYLVVSLIVPEQQFASGIERIAERVRREITAETTRGP